MNVGDPLVSADWLLAQPHDRGLSILDATWVPSFATGRPTGAESYAAAHIPAASYFDIDVIADQAAGLKHMLPAPGQFSEQVGRLGISQESPVIIYDSHGFFASARAWWMFRAMGHEAVWVLDGGLQAWQAVGGAVTSDIPRYAPKDYAATANHDLVRDMRAMRAHVANQDITILDARDPQRFSGAAPEPRAGLPSGHMPGSLCVPASSLITETGHLKSKADLASSLGPYSDTQVVTSCGSGVSAAIISLGLARLGNSSAALYDGSWSEWAAHPDNAIDGIS